MFRKNKNIKLKCEVYARISLCSHCICRGFKKFVTFVKEEIHDFFIKI